MFSSAGNLVRSAIQNSSKSLTKNSIFFRQLPAFSSRHLSTTTAETPGAIKVEFEKGFEVHNLDSAPENHGYVTPDELKEYFETMYTMRRMEITCDTEYKARNIRGFCHLYDGQEAVGVGTNAGLEVTDSWITSYRCHCIALARGCTVEEVIAELFGFKEGVSRGKGGSMHMYRKSHNFYGGQGIVGAQVPVGTGLAFANKYYTPPGEKMPVAIAMYGDGAANQGQIWESANMAKLWGLPMIFCCENNQYGMGTSVQRHSSNFDYYTMGNNIPGIRMDGMNVVAVREGIKFVKEFCAAGNGPMFVEMSTYRYHGHSMSDPGTTYRTREEITVNRQTRDPIEYVKKLLVENSVMTADEVKDMEKTIRKQVQDSLKKAKAGSIPDEKELFTNIYLDDNNKPTFPEYIRMPDVTKSKVFN